MHNEVRPSKKGGISASIKPKPARKKAREDRDRRTYVMSPIKGTTTMSKQWSRYEGWTP